MLENAMAPPASVSVPKTSFDMKDVTYSGRDIRYDKDSNLNVSLRRSSEHAKPVRANYDPEQETLQLVILPPPRKAASDAPAALSGVESPPQVFTVAKYG